MKKTGSQTACLTCVEPDRTASVRESYVRTELEASEQKPSSDKVRSGPKTSGRKEAPDAVSCAEMKNHRECQNSGSTGSKASPRNRIEKQISLPTVLQDRAKNSHGIRLAAQDQTGKRRLSREQDATGDVKQRRTVQI
jgi:hypothetical protein